MSLPSLTHLPEPPEGVTPAERRGCIRYYYRGGRPLRFLERRSFRAGWAVLQDVSAHGVGLLLGHRPEPGTVVLLQLAGGRPGETHTRLARVVRTEERGVNWFAGCQLTPPLADADLDALRRACQRPG